MTQVRIERVDYQGQDQVFETVLGTDGLTDLGVRMSVADYMAEGSSHIRVFIDNRERTELYRPTTEEVEWSRQNRRSSRSLRNIIGNLVSNIFKKEVKKV